MLLSIYRGIPTRLEDPPGGGTGGGGRDRGGAAGGATVRADLRSRAAGNTREVPRATGGRDWRTGGLEPYITVSSSSGARPCAIGTEK